MISLRRDKVHNDDFCRTRREGLNWSINYDGGFNSCHIGTRQYTGGKNTGASYTHEGFGGVLIEWYMYFCLSEVKNDILPA